jgi:N-acetylneuraminic acid mutarotase
MKWRLFLCVLVLIGLFSCKDDVPVEPITKWTHLKDFPGDARASASGFVYGNKAFICLGRSELSSGFLKDLWEYDTEDSIWTRKTDFPGKARVKAVTGVIGDKAYVGLGAIAAYDLNAQFSDFYEYDIKTDVWTQKASFPGEAKNALFSTVVDGCLYTTEGFSNLTYKADTYKYDPKNNTWTRLADCPVEHGATAGFSMESCFYEGTGFRGRNYKDFYKYDIQSGKWSRVADLPDGRILSQGMAINGKGYIMLGRYWHGTENGGRLLDDIVEYDPAENLWTKKGSFPGGARQNAVALSVNGMGYILTGETDSKRMSDFWSFQP